MYPTDSSTHRSRSAPVSSPRRAVAVSLRGARRELAVRAGTRRERTAPLAGLVAAFIFAVQMLNFPVAAGTSGHLLGGALAAILVGPYTGVLCVSVVLLMQGVLFADGGLTALGVNITDMAIVTTVVAYALFRGLVKVLPRSRRSDHRRRLRRRADLGAGRRRRLHPDLRDRRHHRRPDRQGLHRHGRRARPDRHRRGRDHRADRRRRHRRPPRPGARRPRPDQPLELRTRRRRRRSAGRRPRPPAGAARPRRPARSTRPSGWPASSPRSSRRRSSPSTPPPAPTAWRRSPHDKGIDEKAEDHAARTPRSPTTASRTSPTPGSPAASPG